MAGQKEWHQAKIICYSKTKPRYNTSPTEAKRDMLLALTQLSLSRVLLSRVLLSRAYLRFTGQINGNRSNATEETKGVHDILFALSPRSVVCYLSRSIGQGNRSVFATSQPSVGNDF